MASSSAAGAAGDGPANLPGDPRLRAGLEGATSSCGAGDGVEIRELPDSAVRRRAYARVVDDRATTSGLTTVVFVDIEGSTALLDRVGDDAGVASVRRQLDVVAERIEAYGGRVVKSTGDGFLMTFSSPRQAVAFALASQRALAGSLPRVRFGINTGEVDDVDADPLGGAVNAAARIAARADGGEVLVSDVVRQLAGDVTGGPVPRSWTVPAARVLRALAAVGGRGAHRRRAGDDDRRAGRRAGVDR